MKITKSLGKRAFSDRLLGVNNILERMEPHKKRTFGGYIAKNLMKIDITQDCTAVDWRTVSETLKSVGMAYHQPDMHQKAFEASHTTVFVYNAGQLIGFGRAISDGVYQAAIYDCAVVPEFQGMGIGTTIMENIMAQVSHCNVILYASPGKEGFYQKHGFRKMKTGMANFTKGVAMKERGFTE